MSGKGIDLKIQRDGSVICAGIVARNISIPADPIEITSDDDQGWRCFLADSWRSSTEIGFEGIARESLFESVIAQGNCTLTSVYLVWPDGAMLFGDFLLAGCEQQGEYQQAITFTCVLLSIGEVVYVANDRRIRLLENGEIRLLEDDGERLLE